MIQNCRRKSRSFDISCNRNFFLSWKHQTWNYISWIVAWKWTVFFFALYSIAGACIILSFFDLQTEISNVNRIWLGYRCNKIPRQKLWGVDFVLVNKSQVNFKRVSSRKKWKCVNFWTPAKFHDYSFSLKLLKMMKATHFATRHISSQVNFFEKK